MTSVIPLLQLCQVAVLDVVFWWVFVIKLHLHQVKIIVCDSQKLNQQHKMIHQMPQMNLLCTQRDTEPANLVDTIYITESTHAVNTRMGNSKSPFLRFTVSNCQRAGIHQRLLLTNLFRSCFWCLRRRRCCSWQCWSVLVFMTSHYWIQNHKPRVSARGPQQTQQTQT